MEGNKYPLIRGSGGRGELTREWRMNKGVVGGENEVREWWEGRMNEGVVGE